jgi:hypothetical protein
MNVMEFNTFVQKIKPKIECPRNIYNVFTVDQQSRCRYRHCDLNTNNRVLLILMWMSGYDLYWSLCLTFGVNYWTILRDVRHHIPIFVQELANDIGWPTLEECHEQRSSFSRLFPNVIGAIDCTHHPIRRPHLHQRAFYRNVCFLFTTTNSLG